MDLKGKRTYILCAIAGGLFVISGGASYLGDLATADMARNLGNAVGVAAIAMLRAS